MLRQACLDFSRLDADSADFHLLVHAPQILDSAILPEAREIAGPVKRGAPELREGILDEHPCR